MDKIQVAMLNPKAIQEAEKLMVLGARLTQRGETIQDLNGLLTLYEQPYSERLIGTLVALPHPTIRKLATVTIAVVGASRRFLAQITRHQNEVKFISASLQYSDYSKHAQFVTPYSLLKRGEKTVADYQELCRADLDCYEGLIRAGLDNDSAGYVLPQSLRNVLLISATPYQLKHMIGQRVCRRNTPETRYVMLLIWKLLWEYSPTLFMDVGAFCQKGTCQEGKMSCGNPMITHDPLSTLYDDFPLLMENSV